MNILYPDQKLVEMGLYCHYLVPKPVMVYFWCLHGFNPNEFGITSKWYLAVIRLPTVEILLFESWDFYGDW